MKQLLHVSRFSVRITALNGRLKGESLLGLWDRRKKYTTEKKNPCLHKVSSSLPHEQTMLQHLRKKNIFKYTCESRESMGIPRTRICSQCCLSQSPWCFSLPVYVTYCTHSPGRVSLYELPLPSPQPLMALMSSATGTDRYVFQPQAFPFLQQC